MERVFVSSIKIDKVRHLNSITIDLSSQNMKHLIITGKNGSGKTSLLDAMSIFLNSITSSNNLMEVMCKIETDEKNLECLKGEEDSDVHIRDIQKRILYHKKRVKDFTSGVMLKMNCSLDDIQPKFAQGDFVVAYYRADRVFKAQEPKHVEKVILKSNYTVSDMPREEFIKYLLDLKMTQALAVSNNKIEKAERIKEWFEKLQDLLKVIFEDGK